MSNDWYNTTDGHYHHPFHGLEWEWNPGTGKEHPRTVIELRMSALSSTIREKPQWWVKMKSPKITTKWRAEVLEQQSELPEDRQLTEEMIDYVFAELEGYASLREESTGIEQGSYDRIWKSDSLIPPELRAELLAAVAPLENASDNQKDWHPGSNEQVLDLVHPSLYPIVYNRSIRKLNDSGLTEVIELPEELEEVAYYVSRQFQWLPSDFSISDQGTVELSSPYINNVHPTRDAKLQEVLPKILSRAVPLFERVLSDLKRPLLPWRISSRPQQDRTGYYETDAVSCIWPNGKPYPESDTSEWTEYETDPDEFFEKQPRDLPVVKGLYGGDLKIVEKTVSLNGATIQCIIKLANIVLTPEKPAYHGGKWHVEGMVNEHIVASFIYYYETENITESRLAFRRATSEPIYHEQDDDYCMKVLYEMERQSPCIQEVGSILTPNGRSIAFPNIYQHQVAPFRLEDPLKPGYRKILVVFLVDPTIRVPSATEVPPQQQEYVLDAMRNPEAGSLFGRLPVELVDITADLVEGTITREEAEKYRLELMGERTVFVDRHDSEYFGQEFNMCEH